MKEFIEYVVDAIEEALLFQKIGDVVRRDKENRQNREKRAQDIMQLLIVESIGENGYTQAKMGQNVPRWGIDGIL